MHDNFDCKQEPTISRIDKKLDVIDEKLDKFLEKTTRIETQMGAVKTGFVVVLGPAIVAAITYVIEHLKR
jgi:hypothetical protein